jgi:hypothetical protein
MSKHNAFLNHLFAWAVLLSMFLLMQTVSSVPPVQTTTSEQGLQIAYPQYSYVPQNSNFTLYIHTYNTSMYLTGAVSDCYVDLYNSRGVETAHNKMTAGTSDYYQYISSGNFSDLGSHAFVIQCNTTTQTGFANGMFEVTKGGLEITVGRAIIDIGLLLIFIIFLVGAFAIFFTNENLLIKVGMFGLGYLLLIAITFIAWNMASDFLLSAPFLVQMFRIMFIVLVIGAFPLLIGAFAYYIIMLFKIKEIERLMTKGMSFEEASNRQGRKFK